MTALQMHTYVHTDVVTHIFIRAMNYLESKNKTPVAVNLVTKS